MRTTLTIGGLLCLLATGARAELQPLHHVDLSTPQRQRAEQLSTAAANAIARADYGRALQLADQGLEADPNDAWLHYDKGVALFGLQRLDAAVAELDAAERLFPPEDVWGRSVAIYQRAIKLQQAGRCGDADHAFRQYSSLVGPVDAGAAQVATAYAATACSAFRPPVAARQLIPREERKPVRGRDAVKRECPPSSRDTSDDEE